MILKASPDLTPALREGNQLSAQLLVTLGDPILHDSYEFRQAPLFWTLSYGPDQIKTPVNSGAFIPTLIPATVFSPRPISKSNFYFSCRKKGIAQARLSLSMRQFRAQNTASQFSICCGSGPKKKKQVKKKPNLAWMQTCQSINVCF